MPTGVIELYVKFGQDIFTEKKVMSIKHAKNVRSATKKRDILRKA